MKKKNLEKLYVGMFPSGFISYTETFYEVATKLGYVTSKDSTVSEFEIKVMDLLGSCGSCILYDITREITLAFEQANVGREWDGEFYDEVDKFTINYILKHY